MIRFQISSVPRSGQGLHKRRICRPHPLCHTEANWYSALGLTTGERVHVTIDKEGYKTVEKDISVTERKARKKAGEGIPGTDPGSGTILMYTFKLEPVPDSPIVK